MSTNSSNFIYFVQKKSEPVFLAIKEVFGKVLDFQPNQDIFSDLLTFTVGLFALTIPITITILTRISDRYKDQEITRMFIKEKIFKIQNISLGLSLFFLAIIRFSFEQPPRLVLVVSFVWFVANLIILFLYFKRMIRYIIETDKVIFDKIDKEINNVFK